MVPKKDMKGIILAIIAAALTLEHGGNPVSLTALLIPLGFIKYSEAMGAYIGPTTFRGGRVDKETPSWMISAAGYAWLLGKIFWELWKER